MAGPFDYTIDIQSPFTSLTQGLQLGAGIADIRAQQQARELKMQQEQAALEQHRMMQQEVQGFLTNPTAQGVLRLSTLMPAEQAKSVREGWAALDSDTAKKRISQVSQVSSALMSSTPEVGINMLMDMAEGARNAGKEDEAKQYEAYAKTAKVNPNLAALTALVPMAGTEEGKRAIEAMITAQKAPAEVAKGEATAEQERVKANFAESQAALDLTKAGWDIKAIQNDMEVKKRNSQIYAMNAALSREANDLKRQELGLRIDEMVRDRDAKVREKAAEAQANQSKLDNAITTIGRIEAFDDGVLGSVLGPVSSRLPTISQKSADLEGLIQQLGSQAFLSAVAEAGSMAGLTETEGAKLQASAAQLSLSQSVPQFKANLNEFKRNLNKAKQGLATKYGIPLAAPAPAPASATGDAELDALLSKYGAQ